MTPPPEKLPARILIVDDEPDVEMLLLREASQ